jgi:peptidoglycan/LPS O-acetylase OafA/YrhL
MATSTSNERPGGAAGSLMRPPLAGQGIAIGNPPLHVAVASNARSKPRISALDFVKGALVLVMVLYHWLNYFSETDYLYRYLRFLTPSFIFITGFIVSHVRLSRTENQDPRTWRRLMHRGLKILAVFVVLNVVKTMLVDGSSVMPSFDRFVGIYITGNAVGGGSEKAASFFILVPLAYLLFITAALTVAVRHFRHAVHVATGLSLLVIALLAISGRQNNVLEMVSAGLLGASVGYIPIERINAFAHRPFVVAPLVVAYLVALSKWGEVYALQIVGVFLMLTLMYVAYGNADKPDKIRQVVVLLGKYSLVGYIGQIAVLQVLRRSMAHVDPGDVTRYVALVGTVMLTVLIAWVTDRARSKVIVIDRLYVAVFG